MTIDISDCVMGQVTETLCDGWTYVPDSATSTGAGGVNASTSGNDVTFALAGYQSFTYTVEAPDTQDACCTIKGGFKDINQGKIPIQVT